MKIITALLLISLSTISFAKGHSGSGTMNYDPNDLGEQGFEIQIDYNWALSSLMQEPLKGIQVTWSFVGDNSAVPVSFREVQTGKMISTSVPREIVERCRPISIELTGDVKDTRGVTLSIDGGVFGNNGESYNVKGSPAWNKLFKDNNSFMPKLKAQELYQDKNFELSFTKEKAKVKFDLTPIKKWFALSELDKRAKTYCEELDRTYSNLKKISSKFPYKTKKSKLDKYCQYPAAKVIDRLKNEVDKLNDQDFIKSYFDGQEVTKATVESSRAYSASKNKTDKLLDMNGNVEVIRENIIQEEMEVEDEVLSLQSDSEYEAAAVEQLEAESGETFEIIIDSALGTIVNFLNGHSAEFEIDGAYGKMYRGAFIYEAEQTSSCTIKIIRNKSSTTGCDEVYYDYNFEVDLRTINRIHFSNKEVSLTPEFPAGRGIKLELSKPVYSDRTRIKFVSIAALGSKADEVKSLFEQAIDDCRASNSL